MKLLLSLILTICLINSAFAVKIDIHRPTVVSKTIDHGTWVEEKNNQFDNINVGSLLGYKKNIHARPLPKLNYDESLINAPSDFDSTTQWPNCTTIGQINNQARCGSCWAFGAIESFTDRLCIHKNEHVQISFEDMVTCDTANNGCEGGDASSAWSWLMSKGAVSEECMPYTIPTCPPAQQPCLDFVTTPSCVKKCESNSTLTYATDKRKVAKAYSVDTDAKIMNEISTNGPVESCFDVYADFLGYKSGVYTQTSNKFLGGHCVKLIGYGTLNGVPYYLANNQWTTSWGNNGQFMIKQGECGISDGVVTGMPA